MICTVIILLLEFAWLLYQTNYPRLRLLIGHPSPDITAIEPKVAAHIVYQSLKYRKVIVVIAQSILAAAYTMVI